MVENQSENELKVPTRAKFDLKAFFKLLKNTKPKYWQLSLGLVLGIIASLAQLAVPKLAQTVVNGFKSGIDPKLIVLVLVLFIISAILSACSGIILSFFGEDVVAKLRDMLWNKLIRLHVSYFDNVKSGEMTSRLVNDTTQIKDLLATSFPQMINALLQFFGALLIMTLMDWKMTTIMFITIPVTMLIMLPIMKKSGEVGRQRQDALSKFSGVSDETLSEIRLVKTSDAEPHESKNGAHYINRLYKIGLKEAIYDSIVGPIMSSMMLAVIVGLLGYASVRVMNGSMLMGTMVSFLMYLFQIMSPIAIVAQFFTTISKAAGSTERVREVLAEPEEQLETGDGSLDVTGKTLRMEHVDFGYTDDQAILKDINIEAKPNTVVAFAGPSGGGKSTIFSLLERFYTPTAGKITIAGENITDLSLNDWRSQIGFVSQDSAIMAGTIRHNLTYGLDAQHFTDQELWHVLELAYADKFVKEMPDGLDTEVGARGVKISGGQRQRLSIARAFLRDPKILMLDEATASLDSESEAMVQQALSVLMQDRTTLTIAHRLSTIVDADNIYFIDHGQVSGNGTHQELMDQLPLYRDYVKIQFKS